MRFKTLVFVAFAVMTASLFSQTARPAFSSNGGFGKLPLTFELNQGQSASHVQFISRGPGYHAYLTNGSIVLSLRSTSNQALGSKRTAAASQRSSIQLRLV